MGPRLLNLNARQLVVRAYGKEAQKESKASRLAKAVAVAAAGEK